MNILKFKNKNFLKQKPTVNNGNIIIRKPIIYLYPEKETAIDLKFDFVGKLATTFPKYDKNWSVIEIGRAHV